MADRRRRTGTVDTPIEISDSDDESVFLANPVEVIDLTDNDRPVMVAAQSSQHTSLVMQSPLPNSVSLSSNPAENGITTVASQQQPVVSAAEASTVTREPSHPIWKFSPFRKGLRMMQASPTSSCSTSSTSEEDAFPQISSIKGTEFLSRTFDRPEVEQSSLPPLEYPPVVSPAPRRISEDTDLRVALGEARRDQPEDMKSVRTRPSLPLRNMEYMLEEVKKVMGDHHATYVRNLLRDANNRSSKLQSDLPDFTDSIDPFADMPALEENYVGTTNTMPTGATDDNAVYLQHDPAVQRVPPYKHYTSINQNIMVADTPHLAFDPYLGDVDEMEEPVRRKWLEGLSQSYPKKRDDEASSKAEKASCLYEYLPMMLDKVELDMISVLTFIADERNSVDSGEFFNDTNPITTFLAAFEKVFSTKLQDIIPKAADGTDNREKSTNLQREPKDVEPLEKLLGVYLEECPICHMIACGVHGDYESGDSDDNGTASEAAKHVDLNMPFKGMMARRSERLKGSTTDHGNESSDDEPCSDHCFLNLGVDPGNNSDWEYEALRRLQVFVTGMNDEHRVACLLAPIFGRRCCEIHKIIPFIPLLEKESQIDYEKGPRAAIMKKLLWYDQKSKTIPANVDLDKKTNTHAHHKRYQPIGCNHVGLSCSEAGENCMCITEDILCDKFCVCSDECFMKFKGCSCHRIRLPCSKKSNCACLALNRECDPDLCHNCGAVETANPFTRHEDPPPNSCCNTAIQRGVRKRLLIGKSSHPADIGFGAYLAETVADGEFIAEYVGEVISNGEAERRGDIYDKLKVSFLFNLNSCMVVDGYRYGNKERFINHSQIDANCEAAVKLVNGEHRIGLWATKSMPAGVELFFNYGDDFIKKHGLSEKLGRPVEEEVVEPERVVRDRIPPMLDSDTDEYEEGRPRQANRPKRTDRPTRPKREVTRPSRFIL